MGWGGSESNKAQYSTVVKYSRVQYKVPELPNLPHGLRGAPQSSRIQYSTLE